MNLGTIQEVYLIEIVETTVAKWGSSGSSSGCTSCCFQAAKEGRQSGAANGEPCSGFPQQRVALSRVGKVLERSSSASKASREGLEAKTYLLTQIHPRGIFGISASLRTSEAARTGCIITPWVR